MEKNVERNGRDKVLRQLSTELIQFGFSRTKSTYFTRPKTFWIELAHIHKFSFGPYLRIHLGIRVLGDEEDSVALNGPDSDKVRDWRLFFLDQRRYSFEYESSSSSIEKCQTYAGILEEGR